MQIKMIVTDLDRTLLRDDKTISAYTAKVLSSARARGIKLVFATARPKRTVSHFFEDIEVDALVLHNGAVTHIGKERSHLYGIDSETKDRLLNAIMENHPQAPVSVEIDDTLYANFDARTIWDQIEFTRTDFKDLPKRPADKIIIGLKDTKEAAVYKAHLPEDLYIEVSEGELGLIMNRDATKWNAVTQIAQHFGIREDAIVAFGDDFNDIEMLRGAGYGVAVQNALEQVKAVADEVCGSNQEDGVARWIENNVLGSL